MQVLIADDDKVSRRMLAHKLNSWGYEVLSANDGTEAWLALQRPDAPRLAILDWVMPGMTGPAVCQELRRLRTEPYTYVLLLTARTNTEDVVEGMDSGADDYITKPFNAQELQVRLRAGRRIVDLQSELVSAREALREQATRDPLTCVWNRYAILDTLNREVSRACREASPLSVIMADLDNFKRVNDTHGHLVGDAVLREAARRMQACVRAYDYVGRYGGEEFLIVSPGSSGTNALQLAGRLRDAIAAEPIRACNLAIPITASFGITVMEGREDPTAETLIRIADEALYRAKASGKNRIEAGGFAATKSAIDLEKLMVAVGPPGNG
jgi:two-component system, cell cycle response regulator